MLSNRSQSPFTTTCQTSKRAETVVSRAPVTVGTSLSERVWDVTHLSLRTKPRFASSNDYKEQIIMFETAILQKRTTSALGHHYGAVAFALLLGAGYVLVT